MKRILLSALFAVPFIAMSQTTILTENFDAYNDMDMAGAVSPWMGTWSNPTGTGTDDSPITNTESSSPNNSVAISGPQAGGAQDPMIVFPSDYTSGRYEFTMKYKVASGMGAYFNAQSSGASPGTSWMCDVFFLADGTGTANAGGQALTFNYTNGAWIDVMVIANLDTDEGELWIDGFQVGGTFTWSLESGGAGTAAPMFGGINLYSLSGDPVADCEYYVDDIMLVNTTGVGLDETPLAASMNVVPNPSNGNFVLNYTDMSMENAKVTLVDVLGQTIYSKNMSLVGNATLDFDLDLRNGVYFVSVANGKTKMTKKIIVKK